MHVLVDFIGEALLSPLTSCQTIHSAYYSYHALSKWFKKDFLISSDFVAHICVYASYHMTLRTYVMLFEVQ